MPLTAARTAVTPSVTPYLLPPVEAASPDVATLPLARALERQPGSRRRPIETMSWSLRVAVVLMVLLIVATVTAIWQYRERVASKAQQQAAEIPSVDDDLVLATFNDSDDRVTAEALSPQGERNPCPAQQISVLGS